MPCIVLPEPGLVGLPFLRTEIAGSARLLCHQSDAVAARDRFPGCTISTYGGGNLTPSRDDLPVLSDEAVLVRDEARPWGWDGYVTALGLMGVSRARLVSQSGSRDIRPPRKPNMGSVKSLLLVACGGMGNLIQATPLLAASLKMGLATYFCPVADGPGPSPASLFRGALDGLIVVEPDELDRVDADIRLNIEARAHLRAGEFFHSPYREPSDRSEPEAYARFFENVTGHGADPGQTCAGGFDADVPDEFRGRVVLCPGSKPGWDSKRWPHFKELATRLGDPVILCREPDLAAYDALDFLHPLRTAGTVITDASLAQAAAILRSARGVIANDCGPAHLAAATGTPTLVLFGPSSLKKNRPLAPNARSLSLGLDCQPCQGRTDGPGRLGPGEFSCELGYRCLMGLTVDRVLAEAQTLFNASEVCA